MASADQQQMGFQEAPLYAVHASPSAALEVLARALEAAVDRLRVQVLLSKLPLPELADAIGRGATTSSAQCNATDSVAVLRVARTWGRTQRHRVAGNALVLRAGDEASQVWLAVSDGPYAFWDRVLGHALRHSYPHVSFPSYTTSDIRGWLSVLAETVSVSPDQMRVTGMSLHSRITDPTAERQTQVGRVWTDLSLSYAFDAISEQNAAVKKLQFHAERNGSLCVAGYIARDGEVGIQCGFQPVRRAVLEPCTHIAAHRFRQLDDRARVREHGFAARPFFIEFPFPVFESPTRQARLIEVLEAMPQTSHAVMHANPYLHVSLFDRLEETNCDVYVLSDTRICVVPQTRSSPTALSRLFAYISTEFAEGEVRDYAEVYG